MWACCKNATHLKVCGLGATAEQTLLLETVSHEVVCNVLLCLPAMKVDNTIYFSVQNLGQMSDAAMLQKQLTHAKHFKSLDYSNALRTNSRISEAHWVRKSMWLSYQTFSPYVQRPGIVLIRFKMLRPCDLLSFLVCFFFFPSPPSKGSPFKDWLIDVDTQLRKLDLSTL